MEIRYRHFADLARRAAHRYEMQFTRFLDPSQEREAEQAAREEGITLFLFGGYEDAERRMACFTPTDEEPTDWPLLTVKAEWNEKYGSVEHRDLLGAVMALGLTRESFGDILIDAGRAFLFATEEAGSYLLANLDSAGRTKLKLSTSVSLDELPEPKGVMVRDTVLNMRLDALLAGAFSLGRAEAKQLIDRGLVRVNHVEELRAGYRLKENDLVSARGKGRFRVMEEQGQTRKGRTNVLLFRYGK